MKLEKIMLNFIMILLFAGIVAGSPYLVDENMNLLENDIYNATNVNSTNIYQNGLKALDTGDTAGLNVNHSDTSTLAATATTWDGETGQADLNVNSSTSATFWASVSSFLTRWFSDDANVLSFNEILLNDTIDARSDFDTRWSIDGTWIYNYSGDLSFNRTSGDARYYTQASANTQFIADSTEGDLNVNNSDYWDDLDTPSDIGSDDITDDGTWLQIGDQRYNETYDANEPWLYETSNTFYFNESKLATIYYNASASSAIEGVIDGGTLSDTNEMDGITFNFSEAAGSPGLDLRVNWTDMTIFTTGILRYKTSSLAGDYPLIQLWSYTNNEWHTFPALGESTEFVTITEPVYNYEDHVSGGVVQMRIYKAANGNTGNHYYMDWLQITRGYGTPAGEEIDPYSVHRDGNTTLTGNWDTGGYNITAPIFDGDLNGTANDSDALEGTSLGTLTDGKTCTYDLAGTEIDCDTTLTTGTVTSIATTSPIDGGTITGSGTISLTVCGNAEGYVYNSTSGAWECEALGSGTGSVTSVATDDTYLTGGPITGTGTISLNESILNDSIEAYGYSTTVGTVTSVTGTSPIVSSEGTTPAISATILKDLITTAPLTGAEENVFLGTDSDITIAMPVATTSADGYLSSTDWNTFDGKSATTGTMTSVTAGNGLDFSEITSSGAATLGTPTSITSETDNAVTTTSHTHTITSVNASKIANFDIACPAGYFVEIINMSEETTTCTDGAGAYLKNDGDTATGNYTFDTDTVFIDSTNNKVGIGTINPVTSLHINHTNQSSIGFETLNGTFIVQVLGKASDIARNGHFEITDLTSVFLTIENSTGNVGIGTTSPSVTLDVEKTTPGVIFEFRNTAAMTGLIGEIGTAGVSYWSQKWYNSQDEIYIGLTNSEGVAISNDSVLTSGTNLLEVKNTGEVLMLEVYSDTPGGTNCPLLIDNTGKIGCSATPTRFKTNLEKLTNANWLYDIDIFKYDYLDVEKGINQMGYNVSQVEEINPNIVLHRYNESDEVEAWSVNEDDILIALHLEVKNLRQELDDLKAELGKTNDKIQVEDKTYNKINYIEQPDFIKSDKTKVEI